MKECACESMALMVDSSLEAEVPVFLKSSNKKDVVVNVLY